MPRAPVVAAATLVATTLTSVPALSAADTVEASGHVLRVAIPAAAWYTAHADDDREGEIQFAKAFTASAAAALVLKKTVDKERPNGDDEAFPSGHATTAFAGAAFLQRRYGWQRAWPAWLLSVYTGWTRVHADEHEWEDVAGGAALAVAGAWLFVTPREDLVVTPTVSGDSVGLRLDFGLWR